LLRFVAGENDGDAATSDEGEPVPFLDTFFCWAVPLKEPALQAYHVATEADLEAVLDQVAASSGRGGKLKQGHKRKLESGVCHATHLGMWQLLFTSLFCCSW
jgi:hypothetical protein